MQKYDNRGEDGLAPLCMAGFSSLARFHALGEVGEAEPKRLREVAGISAGALFKLAIPD